jgi:hypothetical protein
LLTEPTQHVNNTDYELYSIIDSNNTTKWAPDWQTTNPDTIAKHCISKNSYNLFDDKDEHSIRKFLAYLYNSDEVFKPNEENINNH